MGAVKKIEIGPQEGPQTEFLNSTADIVIYGGAAGGGKSYGLLLEPLRHHDNEDFEGVIFRRTTPQITNPGALWSIANDLYSIFGGVPNYLTYKFPSGMSVRFAHMEHEKNKYDWQGSQIPYIGFDEVTHFTESQFFYMLSRNRSDSGVPGYIRATCNPDPDSWVRRLLDWWIGEDGFPIPERDGVVRWFRRINDDLVWADHKIDEFYKSITFISAKLSDNKILMDKDPGYRANLEALPYVERMQLLGGNWNVKPAAGLYFKSTNFEIVDVIPSEKITWVRYWDRASSEATGADWTVGVKMGRDQNGTLWIADVIRFRGTPLKVRQAIKNAGTQDGIRTIIGIEQDPGQAGVVEAEDYVRYLAGHIVKLNKVSQNKIVRASPLSAQAERGNVKLLRGKWNDAFLAELQSFPEGGHDDQVDSASGAFHLLVNGADKFTDNFVNHKGSTIIKGQPQW